MKRFILAQCFILLVIIVAGFAYYNYFQWKSAHFDIVSARDSLDNTIAIKEILLRWDKDDGVSEGWINRCEEEIKEDRKDLQEMRRHFEYMEKMLFFDKLIYDKEQANLIGALETNLAIKLKETIASLYSRSKNR